MYGVFFNLDEESDKIRIILCDSEDAAYQWVWQWLLNHGHAELDDNMHDAIESFQNSLGMFEYLHVYPVADARAESLANF